MNLLLIVLIFLISCANLLAVGWLLYGLYWTIKEDGLNKKMIARYGLVVILLLIALISFKCLNGA